MASENWNPNPLLMSLDFEEFLKTVSYRVKQELASMSAQTALRTERSFRSLIALLRQTQSSFRPAVRLPPEILGEIFQYACSWCFRYHLAQRWTDLKEILQSLRKVLHVCHHWRMVAHGVPALWNCLDNSFPSAKYFFLERSRTGDLAAIIDFWREHGDFEYFCKSHSSRLHELHIQIGYKRVSPDFYINPTRLRRLRFCMCAGLTWSTSSIMTTLFTACSSSLEQMQLKNFDGIPHHRFDKLTYLQLVNVSASVTEFLELLSNCPNLTDLQLFNPKIREGGANDDYVFSLPNLRRLRIEIHPSVLAASLISKIPLRTSVATQIHATTDDVPQEFLEAISQLPIMQATAKAAISSKGIIAVTDVSGIRGPCSLMQALPMQQIRELWVYGPENHSRVDHCPTLLPFLVKLEVLVLCDTLQLDQVLDALAPPGNIESRPVCPKLHTIRIIMTKNPWTAPSIFQRVAEHQLQLQLSRFSCHWIPTYSDFFRTSYESEYRHLFPTTEFDVKLLDHDGLARMKVPDACLADEDNDWPSMLRGPTHTLL